MEDVELPKLPFPRGAYGGEWEPSNYTEQQMHEYARAAILAEREARATAWEAQHGFDKYGVALFIRTGELP